MAAGRRRALGQHFLRDPHTVRSIVDLASLTKNDLAVEIGPGTGALTGLLSESAGRLLLLEIDKDLLKRLKAKFAGSFNIEYTHADARQYPFIELRHLRPGASGRVVVVGNLPYSVSKPILFRLIEARAAIDLMVLTIQKEVADRIVAEPGSKRYGSLSVLTQLVMEPKIAFTIPAGAFNPPPKVESAVVQMTPLTEPRVPVLDEAAFRQVVKAAFSQRRKTLANALSGGLQLSSQAVQTALRASAIDSQRRAETLTLSEFSRLTDQLKQGSDET
jgi:16S rRNA (adenine1518-N6/adenine1519-N6)-dimethyltransferase